MDKTTFLTLEALVSSVADLIASQTAGLNSLTVCGGKPNALACAEAAEVKTTRSARDLAKVGTSALTAPEGI